MLVGRFNPDTSIASYLVHTEELMSAFSQNSIPASLHKNIKSETNAIIISCCRIFILTLMGFFCTWVGQCAFFEVFEPLWIKGELRYF